MRGSGYPIRVYNGAMIRVETVLDSWKSIRNDTILAVEEFPPSDLDFRATPDCMTFRALARHILDAGHGLTGILLAGVENLQTPEFRQLVQQHASGVAEDADAATLAGALRTSIEERCAAFAAQPPEFFSAMITRFDGARVTRLEMLQFIKEHELTHRAQMFVSMRLKGITPATTRRRQAAQKK